MSALAVYPSAWINLRTAADILCISSDALLVMRSKMLDEGTWSIEWRPNSDNPDVQSARRCGLLLLRADVERVAKIRHLCRCTPTQAVRIYDAIARYGTL